MSKMLLSNGHLFDFTNPDPTMIDLEMVIQSLSTQVRFNGHLDYFYSIASHTVAMYSVAKMRRESKGVLREILMHDVPEFATGDIVSPMKALLGPEYAKIEERVTRAVRAAFGHLPTPSDIERCDRYDKDIWEAELVVSGAKWEWTHPDAEYEGMMLSAVRSTMQMSVDRIAVALRTAFHMEFGYRETMQ